MKVEAANPPKGSMPRLKRLENQRERLKAQLQKVTKAIMKVEKEPMKSTAPSLSKLRKDLGWTRAQMATIMNASERGVVNWEAGEPMSAVYGAKAREIQSFYNELLEIMGQAEIGRWLSTEMDEFDGHSPADLIKKGETGRVWTSLFYLRTGMPE